MRKTLHLVFSVFAVALLGLTLARPTQAAPDPWPTPPARGGRTLQVYRSAVVASDATHEAEEAAHCACLTGLGYEEWCGGWVPVVGLFDWEIIGFSEIYVWGQAISLTDQAAVEAYRTCAGGGGFEMAPVAEGGQTIDEVVDEGYDPLRPVATLRVACAAGYQTGHLPPPMPPKAVFY
jgi:hypothetical protein